MKKGLKGVKMVLKTAKMHLIFTKKTCFLAKNSEK